MLQAVCVAPETSARTLRKIERGLVKPRKKRACPVSPDPIAKQGGAPDKLLVEAHVNRGEAIPVLPESLSVPPVGLNEMPGQTTDPRSQALARTASRT